MMITTLFKFIYFIGFWIIIAASFALIGIEINGGEEYAFLGLAILTIGNIIWRVFCESLIVIFKIHENIDISYGKNKFIIDLPEINEGSIF